MPITKFQEILEQAARLFNEHGYYQTKMDDIAKAVGLEKGTLYHYFSSKEDILYEVAKQPLQSLIDQISRIVHSELSADRKLNKAIQIHVHMFTTQYYPALFVIAQERIADLPEKYREEFLDMERTYQRLWEEIIRQGIEEGTFEPTLNPRITGFAIVGLCNWMHKWYTPGGLMKPAEIASLFARIVLFGTLKR